MERLAVIGAGAAGIATLRAVTSQFEDDLDVTVFDPFLEDPRKVARGLPYLPDSTEPLLNAPAQFMSVCPDDREHFYRWLGTRSGQAESTEMYASRPVFGDYLFDTLRGLIRAWSLRRGTLELVPREAIRIHRDAQGTLAVETRDSLHPYYDHIIVCVGWAAPTQPDDEHDLLAPYPLENCIPRIEAMSSVTITGTGLTGVDVVRALLERSFRGRITMVSRRGLLPGIRAEGRRHIAAILRRETVRARAGMSVHDFVELIRKEAQASGIDLTEPTLRARGHRHGRDALLRGLSGADDDWSAMMVALADEVMTESWNSFTSSDKSVFLRTLHPVFQSWCNPMPRSTARLLATAFESGQLTLHRGAVKRVGTRVHLRTGESVTSQALVRAHRSGADHFADVRQGLLGALVADRIAVPDDFGGLKVDYPSNRLVGAPGLASNIYLIGAATQGARYYVNALDGIVLAIQDTMRDIRSRGASERMTTEDAPSKDER